MTKYVILERIAAVGDSPANGAKAWKILRTVEATSANAAIRKLLSADNGTSGGQFVAVPERSWAPVTVETKTKRTLTFS